MTGNAASPAVSHSAAPVVSQVQLAEATYAGYSTTAAIGAVVSAGACAVFLAAPPRSRASKGPASRSSAKQIVAMEAGGTVKTCPKTGGPICFCNQNKAAPAIGATAE